MSTLAAQAGVRSNSIVDNFFLEAKKLNDAKWIYGLYGALDGLSNSFSMLKYFFDLYYIRSGSSVSSDALHDWSLTPLGIAVMTIEAAVLMGCSFIGNTVDDDGYYLHLMSVDEAKQLNHRNCFVWHENQLVYLCPEGTETVFTREGDVVNQELINKIISKSSKATRSLHLSVKQANDLIVSNGAFFTKAPPTPSFIGSIAAYWPYARDVMKAMKNTYKGVRNTFVLTDLLIVGREYHYLALPVGLALGVLAAYNRTWLRKIREERKDAKKVNFDLRDSLLKKLSKKNDVVNVSDWDLLHSTLQKEHDNIRSQIQPPSHSQLFWLYAQMSAAFSGFVDSPYLYFGALSLALASPASLFFIYIATASFILAAACIATRIYEEQVYQRELLMSQLDVELAMSMREVQSLRDQLRAIDPALPDLDLKRTALNRALNEKWEACKLIQKNLFYQSDYSIGFVIMSGVKNGVDTYGAIAGLMFFIATIALVMMVPYSPFLVAGFVTLGLTGLLFFPAMALLRHYYPQEKNASSPQKKSTLELFSELETSIDGTNKALKSPPTPSAFDSLFEMFRLIFAGAGKGIRAAEQFFASLQEVGADGHYHDSNSMWIFSAINACLFSFTFGGRGYARLGRTVTAPEKPAKVSVSDITEDVEKKNATSVIDLASKTKPQPADSGTRIDTTSGSNLTGETVTEMTKSFTAVLIPPTESQSPNSETPIDNTSRSNLSGEIMTEETQSLTIAAAPTLPISIPQHSPVTVSYNLSQEQLSKLGMFKQPTSQSPRPNELDDLPDDLSDTARDSETGHCTF